MSRRRVRVIRATRASRVLDEEVVVVPYGSGSGAVVTPGSRNPAGWLERLALCPSRSVAQLRGRHPGRDVLVVVSAHPDDETIGAGRLLSAWVEAAGDAYALLATAGEACVDHVGERPSGLAERRVAEWRGALAALGVVPAAVLGLPDGGLSTVEDQLVEELVERLSRLPPGSGRVVLLAPHPADPHPDHQAVGRAAARVGAVLDAPVWHYPVWLTWWADPATPLDGEVVRVRTDVVDAAARSAALRWFRSQTEPLGPGWGPVVPAAMLAGHTDQLLVLPAGSPC